MSPLETWATRRPATRWPLVLLALLLLFGLAGGITGCGGGDADDDTPPRVVCGFPVEVGPPEPCPPPCPAVSELGSPAHGICPQPVATP
jgi:hypothetical protein